MTSFGRHANIHPIVSETPKMSVLIVIIIDDISPAGSSCHLFDFAEIIFVLTAIPCPLTFGARLLLFVVIGKIIFVIIIASAFHFFVVTIDDEAIVEGVAFMPTNSMLKLLV